MPAFLLPDFHSEFGCFVGNLRCLFLNFIIGRAAYRRLDVFHRDRFGGDFLRRIRCRFAPPKTIAVNHFGRLKILWRANRGGDLSAKALPFSRPKWVGTLWDRHGGASRTTLTAWRLFFWHCCRGTPLHRPAKLLVTWMRPRERRSATPPTAISAWPSGAIPLPCDRVRFPASPPTSPWAAREVRSRPVRR
jgi:hypothetical protein